VLHDPHEIKPRKRLQVRLAGGTAEIGVSSIHGVDAAP
jgi:hypothetical protein